MRKLRTCVNCVHKCRASAAQQLMQRGRRSHVVLRRLGCGHLDDWRFIPVRHGHLDDWRFIPVRHGLARIVLNRPHVLVGVRRLSRLTFELVYVRVELVYVRVLIAEVPHVVEPLRLERERKRTACKCNTHQIQPETVNP